MAEIDIWAKKNLSPNLVQLRTKQLKKQDKNENIIMYTLPFRAHVFFSFS
jgi:hypothetical protein